MTKVFALAFWFASLVPAQIVIEFDPPQSVPLGSSVVVNVYLSGVPATSPATVCGAFDLTIQFDSTILRSTDATFGAALGDAASQEALTGKDLSASDTFLLAETSLLSPADLVARQAGAGSRFVIATLYFEAISLGVSPVISTAYSVRDAVVGDGVGKSLTAPGANSVSRTTKIRVVPALSGLVERRSALTATLQLKGRNPGLLHRMAQTRASGTVRKVRLRNAAPFHTPADKAV